MTEKNLKKLELLITSRIFAVKLKRMSPPNSKLAQLFIILKLADEPLYEKFIEKYKEALKKL